MHNDVDRFSKWAPTYDRHRLQKIVFEPVQQTLLDMAVHERPSAVAILDIGCGTGRLLRAAEERFPEARLQGVDAAEGMVEAAQSAATGSGINFHHATAEQLPFDAAQFDLVFSTMTFHHWSDQAMGISEIARVLKPDGRWLLSDFVPRGLMRYVRRLVRLTRFRERHELSRMLAISGLGIVEERMVPGLWGQVSVLAIGRTR
ncbi:MAG TPA: methyltransferase domain-containing protein [Candidatus Dormibacteraeota bacterium]|nr:methyltransferase domain-containing protein [Candidatus Dormibacteraeota bacterium]